MNVETLEPFGVRVTGVRLESADPVELAPLLAEHGVVVLPGQDDVDDDTFTRWLAGFGPLVFTKGETPVEGHPDLNVVTNVGRETSPVSNWHVDTGYVARPPAYTALRAVQIPSQGGQTLFSNQYAALDTLPRELRAATADREVTHVVTGVPVEDGDEVEAVHPLVRTHPVSGRPALFLDAPKRMAAISGLSPEQAAATAAQLLDHSTQPFNVYRHAWQPGDVVIWDNGVVLHKADHDGVVGDRTMHRGMSAGYAA